MINADGKAVEDVPSPTVLHADDSLFIELFLFLRQVEIFWWLISFLGDGLVLAVIIVPTVWYFERSSAKRTITWLVIAVLCSGLFITAVKEIVGRPRPFERPEIAALQVDPPLTSIPSGRSFPSGHAQTSAATATFLALRYRRGAIVFIILAILVAISRIGLGAHTPLEVVVGFCCGVIGSALVHRWMEHRHGKALRRSSQLS